MFTKYASAKVLDCSTDINIRTAKKTVGSFDYEPRTDHKYMYVSVRACTADVPNLNYDMLPDKELKTAYRTFIGSYVYLNHDNTDPRKARGAIIDAKYHTEDPDDKWIEILMEMDEEKCPKLCSLIRSGEIDTVSMGCFLPGTKITMSDGTRKNIEDVVEGDMVITHEGNAKRVSYTMSHAHNGAVYEISSYAQTSPMLLTEEHPVWIRRPQRKVGDTVRGRIEGSKSAEHVCVCGRSFNTHQGLSAHVREAKRWEQDGEHGYAPAFEGWCEAKDVEIGDYVLDPVIVGGNECSEALARLLGYYLAEGNFCYDKNTRCGADVPCGVEWTFNESEVEYHTEVSSLIETLGYKPVGPYFKNDAATIRCNSPELAATMLELGGKYSWGKRIADSAMHWDVESQRGMLEAYLNGDGHWTDGADGGRHFSFATVSKELAEQIFAICVRCGIRCSEPKWYFPPSSQRYDGQKRMSYIAQGTFDYTHEPSAHLAYVDDKGMWRRVTKIRMFEYSGNVYNLEVEDDHSYVAEGCAVHNCNIESSTCSVCGNTAEYPFEYCTHIQQKGQTFGDKLAYEICNGIEFFEESWVFSPADISARAVGIDDDVEKQARLAGKRVSDDGMTDSMVFW